MVAAPTHVRRQGLVRTCTLEGACWTRLRGKVADGIRLERDELAWLHTHAADDDLSALATQVRARFHPPDRATWLIMAIINSTNVCVAKCDYCAFYVLPNQAGGYLLTHEQVFAKIEELRAFGGTLVAFNGGFHPKIRITDYAALFSACHERFPTSPSSRPRSPSSCSPAR
jgi:cyclic dehypoxanthinyl futalosine synthase